MGAPVLALAGGVAGAWVGSFAGPLGASLGWSIGAAIGGSFGKGPKGPDVATPRVGTSSYGQPIPILYGTVRVPFNEIWGTEFVKHKKKSSGKGTPKPTETTFTRSWAHLLCETSYIDGDGALVNNPIVGINRIWRDGQLVFGEGSDGSALPFTIYYGTEDQLPDPTMEADKGVGNVPAYRGRAYIVWTDYESATTHNWTYEVIASGTIDLRYYANWWLDYDYPVNGSAYSYPSTFNGVERTAEGLTMHRYRSGFDYGAVMGTSDSNVLYYDQRKYDLQGNLLETSPQVVSPFAGSGSLLSVYGSMNSGIAYVEYAEDFNPGTGTATYATFSWVSNGVVSHTPNLMIGPLDQALRVRSTPVRWNGYVYAVGGDAFTAWLRRWPAPDGNVYTAAYDADLDLYPYSGNGAVGGVADVAIGDDGYLYCRCAEPLGTLLIRLDADLNVIKVWTATDVLPYDFGVAGYSSFAIYRGLFISYFGTGFLTLTPQFVALRLDSVGVTHIAELDATASSALVYIGGGLAAFRAGILQLGSNWVTWGEIVADISKRVGFSDAEIDVSELTDQVRGYPIGQRTTARSAIEAGMHVYQHGAVESGRQVKFPKRAKEPVATITADDLGARDDSSDPVDPIEITHRDDLQLPRVVEVVFINYDMEYQDGVQPSRPWSGGSSDINAAVNVSIVLVDYEALAVAEAIAANARLERDTFKWSLPRKWAHLEPTDVIDLYGHTVRITNKDEQGYTHINFEGLRTATGVFINGPVASAPIGFVPQVPPTLNRTDLLMRDYPMMTDADFQVGYYAIMAGRMQGQWPSAGLFKSSDGGVNYDSIYSTVEPDTFGVATTVLADWTGGNVFDESNAVTVRLTPGSGELTSSNELGVLNGANKAMLGDELIQYKTATLDDISEGGARTYTLSGLLRGRRGTEWATGTHALDEVFGVPLHNLEADFSELGQARKYKAVTSGGLLASATTVDFTHNGVSLKPYAPCEVGGGRNGAGDIVTEWTRRTRVGGAWLDNVDALLGEDTEYYAITYGDADDFTTSVTYFSATPTYTYAVADQTEDFGGALDPVFVTVKQFGSYGYGYESAVAEI